MNTGAEMGQRPAEEQRRFGDRDIHRIRDLQMQQKGFANVVEQHEQDDQTT
jgi:hypothetical protein|tara:strand:+ start:386 stop:538 length:153 start_codon:yes stop_codon:yes gene_type:complete